MRPVDGGDPPVGLDHPLVLVADEGEQHVALDQRLGELGLQRVQEARLAGHVARGIDDAVLAAEFREALAHHAQVLLGFGELFLGEADRVGARLVGQLVHQLARFDEDRLRDRRGVLGVKAWARTWMMPGAGLEGDVDHAPPVREQILDRRVGAQGEDRIARRSGVDRAQVELGVDRLDDALAAHVFEQDVGVRGAAGADRGDRPEQPGGRRAGLFRADREGDLGMIVVGGAGVEIADGRRERRDHEQHERQERQPVAQLHARRTHLRRGGGRGQRGGIGRRRRRRRGGGTEARAWWAPRRGRRSRSLATDFVALRAVRAPPSRSVSAAASGVSGVSGARARSPSGVASVAARSPRRAARAAVSARGPRHRGASSSSASFSPGGRTCHGRAGGVTAGLEPAGAELRPGRGPDPPRGDLRRDGVESKRCPARPGRFLASR